VPPDLEPRALPHIRPRRADDGRTGQRPLRQPGRRAGPLEQADRDGLVLQPQNTENPLFVCCCCGCCCGVLTTVQEVPAAGSVPGQELRRPGDGEACQACGYLHDPVPDAGDHNRRGRLEPRRGRSRPLHRLRPVRHDLPSEAIHLEHTPTEHVPPSDTGRLYVQMYRERYGTLGMARGARPQGAGDEDVGVRPGIVGRSAQAWSRT